MNIIIKSIPHKEHRYQTCGDWWFEGDTLHIRVSEEMPQKSQELVALHELAEVFMCMANGVTQEQVDKYDMDYESTRHPDDDSEPGDHGDAPYHFQHRLATAIETIAAAQMGVAWLAHEHNVNRLFE